jgi:cobalt-zinc-cadmium efflux system outer membrane protein
LFNAARRAYQEGKSDYLNVLDAQRTFFELKNEYIQSLAAYHSAGTDIERLIAQQITLLSNTSGKE